MAEALHTYVTMEGDFRIPDSLDEPAGADLAEVLVAGLPSHGIKILNCEASDIAFDLSCEVNGAELELMLGVEEFGKSDSRWWIMFTFHDERSFRGREATPHSVRRKLLFAANEVIHASDRISDVRWYPCFGAAFHAALLPAADNPIQAPDYNETLHPLVRWAWRLDGLNGLGFERGWLVLLVLLCVPPLVLLGGIWPEAAKVVPLVPFFAVVAIVFGRVVLSWLIDQAAGRAEQDKVEPRDAHVSRYATARPRLSGIALTTCIARPVGLCPAA